MPCAPSAQSAGCPAVTTNIRQGQPYEWDQILGVIDAAFNQAKVGKFAEAIRASDRWIEQLSLVAEHDGRIVGHVCFSRGTLQTASSSVDVLQLAPLAVHPAMQRQGIGRALVADALHRAAERTEPFVILEGDPAIYRRLGFYRAADYGIERPSALIPEPAFQLAPLPHYRPDLRGRIVYPQFFYELEWVGR